MSPASSTATSSNVSPARRCTVRWWTWRNRAFSSMLGERPSTSICATTRDRSEASASATASGTSTPNCHRTRFFPSLAR